MFDPRALALGLVDPAGFVSHARRRRRTNAEDEGTGRRLVRALHRITARATEAPAIGRVPKLQRYPY